MEEEQFEQAMVTKSVDLVVFDNDHTITKIHNGVRKTQQPYETPYAANLRCRDDLKQLIGALRKAGAVIACATFGVSVERVKQSFAYLGVPEDEILVEADLLESAFLRSVMGKNQHIAKLIQRYYQRHPSGPRIKRVVLVEDSQPNIDLFLNNYKRIFINTGEWKEDERLRVKVSAVQVPRPRLEACHQFDADGNPRRVVKKSYDSELDMLIVTESKRSEEAYRLALHKVRTEVLMSGKDWRSHSLLSLPALFPKDKRTHSVTLSRKSCSDVIPLIHDAMPATQNKPIQVEEDADLPVAKKAGELKSDSERVLALLAEREAPSSESKSTRASLRRSMSCLSFFRSASSSQKEQLLDRRQLLRSSSGSECADELRSSSDEKSHRQCLIASH